MLTFKGVPMSFDSAAEDLLSSMLAGTDDYENNDEFVKPKQAPATPASNEEKDDKVKGETHSQWAIAGNGRFIPIGSTVQTLKAGIYEPFAVGSTIGMEEVEVVSDSIYQLPDMATEEVLKEVQTFWDRESRYRKHKLIYKRGLLLWGPPGSGKTVTVKTLMNELVKRDGIVMVVSHVNLAMQILKALRRIEPKRNLIVVLEDVDEIIQINGEASLLSMLDGEANVDNILFLATTNYPDRLGARIVNRPSRFDRRIFIGMPSYEARRYYLMQATDGGLSTAELDKWTTDTENMSIAHLRELVAAVYCLEQSYEDVMERLRAMAKPVKSAPDGFAKGELGFGLSPKSR